MNKGTILLVLMSFLFVDTSFGQIMRIPVLVHHYLEHSKVHQESVIDFIIEHYTQDIQHDHDTHNDHANLPFKSADYILNLTLKIISPASSSNNDIAQITLDNTIRIGQESRYYFSYLNSIWQPPRRA